MLLLALELPRLLPPALELDLPPPLELLPAEADLPLEAAALFERFDATAPTADFRALLFPPVALPRLATLPALPAKPLVNLLKLTGWAPNERAKPLPCALLFALLVALLLALPDFSALPASEPSPAVVPGVGPLLPSRLRISTSAPGFEETEPV